MLDVSYIDTSWSCPIASKNDVAFIWILPVMHAPSERINKPEKENSRHECGYGNKDEDRVSSCVSCQDQHHSIKVSH